MTRFVDYDEYDGLGLADLVRRGNVASSELVEEAITRIERLNPQLNAVIQEMYDLARDAAEGVLFDGPFKGVPFLLKDVMASYAGVPSRAGSRFMRDFVPDHDSELVKRFKAAGVIVVGKTNLPEFGLMPVTEPHLFGPTNNPWDLSRNAGGSSGGSAAAVSAHIVPLAHGNDGGGSIRIPASCCGVFGLKPSRGRNPLGPDVADAWYGLVCEHVLTRSVRDSAAMLDATQGVDVGAPYCAPRPTRPFLDEVGTAPGKLRIAFTSEPFLAAEVHPDCIRGLESTIGLCEELGHEVIEASPHVDGRTFADAFLTLVCAETRLEIEEAEAALGSKASYKYFEPETWALSLLGKNIAALDFSRAIHFLHRSARQMGSFFEDYDVLLTPTLATPPLLTGTLQPTPAETRAMKLLDRMNASALMNALADVRAIADRVFKFMPYTPIFNATGQPAMSVPLYWSDDGLPIGMQFVGRYGDEATLFRLAGQLEEARPWAGRVPPVVAAAALTPASRAASTRSATAVETRGAR